MPHQQPRKALVDDDCANFSILRHKLTIRPIGCREAFRQLRRSRRLTTPYFAICYNPGTAKTGCQPFPMIRIGVNVSKKIASAVGRNRIKRQLRALIASNLTRDLPCDWLLIAKPTCTSVNYDQLLQAYNRSVARALKPYLSGNKQTGAIRN